MKGFIAEEGGFVEVVLILVCVVLLAGFCLLWRSVLSHRDLVEAYCEKVRRDYFFEGVLCEAVVKVKEGEEVLDSISSFAPDFRFTVSNGKIILKHQSGISWEADYTEQKEGVVVKNLVTPFTLPYVR